MNARVFVLLLVSAAFMAVWEADQSYSSQVRISRIRHPAATLPIIPQFVDVMPTVDNVAAETHETDLHPVIPLPKNLEPGTWHAISQEGDSFRIRIERTGSPRQSADRQSQPPAEMESRFCIFRAPDNIRWCFVKERTPSAQRASDRSHDFSSPIHR